MNTKLRNEVDSLLFHLRESLNNEGYTKVTTQIREKDSEAKLPSVVIDIQRSQSNPLEIGTLQKTTRGFYTIDIFATSDAERLDLMNDISNIMNNTITLFDFTAAYPINTDGTPNPSFNPVTQKIGDLRINGIDSRRLFLGTDVSEVDRYRGNVIFEVVRDRI